MQWKDIDFDNKLLKVNRQYDRSDTFKKLKTKAGKRTIPLTDQIIKELNRHKVKQSEKKLALGEVFEDNDLVCCNEIGKAVKSLSYSESLKI